LNYFLARILSLVLIIFLTSCGGGGSSEVINVSLDNINTLSTPHNIYSIIDSSSANNIGGGPGTTITPSQIASHYNIPSSLTGVGQNIVIIDAVGYFNPDQIQSDLNVFSGYYNLPLMPYCTGNNAPCLKIIDNSNGGRSITPISRSGSGDWSTEIALDTQWAHAIAPNATITLVLVPTSSGSDLFGALGLQAAINQNNVTSVSMSFGAVEDQATFNSVDTIFSNAISSKGIAFFASTGDNGITSYNNAIYPAASRYVTAVGGTQITSLSYPISSSNEIAWGSATAGASGTGGGYSQYESIPSYQNSFFQSIGNIISNLLSSNSSKRSTPDVSMLAAPASGVGVVVGGAWYTFGGTSLSSPMWAGIAALIGESLNNKGSSLQAQIKSTGSFNDLIYSKATYSPAVNPSFIDITTGTNNSYGVINSCPIICYTQLGYDDVTGIGVPNVGNLINKF
jgi:subtilase family serine protease